MKKIYRFAGFAVLLGLAAGINAEQTPTAPTGVQSGNTAAVSGQGYAQPGVIVYPVPEPVPPPANGEIIQFNNLRIQSISSVSVPAEILATNSDYYPMPMMGTNGGAVTPQSQPQANPGASNATRCYTFKSLDSSSAAPTPCPTSSSTTSSPSSAPPSATTPNGVSIAQPPYPILSRLYRIEIDASTRLRLRDQSSASLSDFAVGDLINIFGIYNQDRSIQALIVRDLSKPVEKQFIQLNNIEVISVSATVPGTIVVIQRPSFPCYNFENGGNTKQLYPCPLGLKSFSDNPSSAGVQAPPSLMPMINLVRKYIVNVDALTVILNRERGRMNIADIRVGDALNVYGTTDGTGETIAADIVRDLTQPATAANMGGVITQVNPDGSFIIQTSDGQTYTVRNSIQVGAQVKLKGILDSLQNIISQISHMTVTNAAPQPPVCNPPVDCAAPPPGCNYQYGNTCSCGRLLCNEEQIPPPVVPFKNNSNQ